MAGRRLTLMNDDSSRYGLRSQTVATSQNEHYTMVINYKKSKKHRMSDHSRRHAKPTSEEVYQDAKRILEEYLKRKLSEHGDNNNKKKYSRSESYKASRENVVDDEASGDVGREMFDDEQYGVGRSKTMPSTYRIEQPQHDSKYKGKKAKNRKDKDSSMETDAEHSDDEDIQKRKKKSFFKRAKERLMHALHRDSRSEDEDVDIYDDSENKQKKKRNKRKVKTLENGMHDSPDMKNRHVKETHAHIDQHIAIGDDYSSRTGSLRIPGEGSSSLQDSHSSSSRRNSAGKKLLDSIRKSFRKSKKNDISESKSAEPVGLEERHGSYSRSISTPDRSSHPGEDRQLENTREGVPSRSGSETPEQRLKGKHQIRDSSPRRNSRSKADVIVSQSKDHSAPRTIQVRGLHLDTNTLSSVAPTPYIPPNFHGSIDSSVDIDRTAEMTLSDDGLWERSVTTHSREKTRYLPQGSLETDGKHDDDGHVDEIDSPDSQQDKEEAIDRIVKKLIEIGDNLSSEGETRVSQESEGAVGGTPRRDEKLSSLEREIIECLRLSGDKASHNIDEHANDLINGAVRETVYEKFSTTLRQSVGDDVNWNQMALVFHATKSALKVAGAGTKMASQIKDLTLKYVTDRWASWIVDQGGWESIVSDTDSELD